MLKVNTPNDIIAKDAADLFSTDKVKKFAEVELVVQQSMEQMQELIFHHADGTEILVEINFSEVNDSEGAAVGKMASLLDITARKKAEGYPGVESASRRTLKPLPRKGDVKEMRSSLIHDNV